MKVNILLFDNYKQAVVKDVELADAATLIDWTNNDANELLDSLNRLTRGEKAKFVERGFPREYIAFGALTQQEILIAHSQAMASWSWGPTRIDYYHDMASSERGVMGTDQKNLKRVNQNIKLVWFVKDGLAVKTFLNLENKKFKVSFSKLLVKPWNNVEHNCVGYYEHPDDSEGVIYDETGKKLPNTFVFVR